MRAVLVLLLGMGIASCYQPVDLVPKEDPDIPWVHCILSPDSTQWLELRYLSRNGAGDYRPVEEAEILLSSHDTTTRRYDPVGRFTHETDGQWRLDMPMEPGQSYQLHVILPSGDTLRAETQLPFDNLFVESVMTPGDSLTFEYTYHDGRTVRITNRSDVLGYVSYVRPDRMLYALYYKDISLAGVCWVYKTGFSKTKGGPFLEETLATDREELVDDFNLTHTFFTESKVPEALTVYPEVKGKPLHYRFLRVPPHMEYQKKDTLAISGDFTGVHYGYCDWVMEGIGDLHKIHMFEDRMRGIPHDEEACRWLYDNSGVGLVHFMTVSEEYDRYLQELVLHELLHDVGTDVIGIYSNTNHYTNVEGGTGIFGAAIDLKKNWTCGVWGK